MKQTLLGAVLCVGLIGQINAQNTTTSATTDEITNKKEVYFEFDVQDKKDLNELTKIISIDHFDLKTKRVSAYANEKQFEAFKALNIHYHLLTKPSERAPVKMWDYASNIAAGPCNGVWDAYPTYSAYVQLMNDYATQYPDLCELINIGSSNDGKDLLVLKISDNVNQEEDEPEFLYTSTMHGDETAGFPLMLHLIDHLLCNYGSDAEVDNIVNNIELYINPLANPDGTYSQSNNSVNGATRSNANGVDLNRNYPDPEDGPHPDGNAYEIETQAFMDFAESKHFVMAANLHGGAEVANYPWDTWGTDHADVDWWVHVSEEYANNAQADSPFGYFTFGNQGYTNGYDWYEVNGGRQDYMNYNVRCREFTLEMSNDKTPSGSDLTNLWDYTKQAFIDYMNQSLYGIRGIVTDSITGEPLDAHIFITDHDFNNSDVYSYTPVGDYHRPIYAGTYTIVASADGYNSKTITNVVVNNNQETRLDIQLYNPDVSIGVNENETSELSIFPNPSNGEVQFYVNKLKGKDFSLSVIDLSGKVIAQQQVQNQADFSVRKMNLSNVAKGIYIVKLSSELGETQQKLIIE